MRLSANPGWLWLNLLSLDAPLVALVWQDFIARCFSTPLAWPTRAALGLTVWAIYIADRLLDAQQPSQQMEQARHRFYRRHQRWGTLCFGLILVIDLVTLLVWPNPKLYRNGFVLATGVLVYLVLFAALGVRPIHLKRFSAAFLFAAGVFVAAWTGTASPTSTLLMPAISFLLLCTANLELIGCWENNRSTRTLRLLLIFFVFAALAFQSRWCLAIACSAAGLAAVAFRGDRLSQNARRVLVDAALLAPALFWIAA